jgi:hypothetical protein
MFLRIHLTKHIHAPRTNDRRNSLSTRKVMTHVSIQNFGKNRLGQSDLSTLVSNKKLDGWRTRRKLCSLIIRQCQIDDHQKVMAAEDLRRQSRPRETVYAWVTLAPALDISHHRVYRASLNRLAYFSYVASSSCARRIDKKWKERNKHQPNNEQGINSKCKITHLHNCIRYQRRRSLRVHNWRKPKHVSKTKEHETCYRENKTTPINQKQDKILKAAVTWKYWYNFPQWQAWIIQRKAQGHAHLNW